MPKYSKKLSLISILVLAGGVVAGTVLVRKVQEIRREAALPVPNVRISPQTQSKNPGNTFNFTVRSNTGGKLVVGMDLKINYNPSALEITGVTKGSSLGDFTELINKIDNANGEITYTTAALDFSKAIQGTDLEFIKVTARVKSNASSGTYGISFGVAKVSDPDRNNINATPIPGEVVVGGEPSPVTTTPTPPPPTTTPTPTSGPPSGKASIFVSPQSQSVEIGKAFNFTVRADTGDNGITGTELRVAYDPSQFEMVSVQKGSGISPFSEWNNKIDNSNGGILYTATTLDLTQTVQGSDLELIKVSARVKPYASPGTFDIGFESGTVLADVNRNNLSADTIAGRVTITTTQVTPTPSPRPTTTPPAGGLPIIEDFEGYNGSDSNLRNQYNYNGNTTVLSLNSNYKYEGTYGGRLDYTVGDPDHSGVWSYLSESKEDWTAYDGINFWLKGDASRREIIVQFSEEDEDHWEAYLTMWGYAPFIKYFPFSQFVKPAWNTTGDGRMELDDISGFAFYVKSGSSNSSPGSGTVFFDTFQLIDVLGPTPTPLPTSTPTVFQPTNTPTPFQPPATFTPTSSPVPSPPSVNADTTLYLVVNPPVYLNDNFQVDLMIDTGKNEVVGTEVYITYDPNMIQVSDIVPGPFFPGVIETIKNIDSSTGKITHVLHIAPQDDPVQGVGTLATLSLKALQEGTTVVDITSESIVGAVNTGYQNALRTRRGVTINIVRPSIVGDINDMGTYCGDGKVNILDYTILFEHFGESPSTHPCADINRDGAVNILDYVLLYENFGKTL